MALNKICFFIIMLFLPVICIANDQSSDTTLGNKWYSRHNFYITSNIEMGLSGVKDYFIENNLFVYKFKSSNRNIFGMRINHTGIGSGVLSGRANIFNFTFMVGFEYMFKIFSNADGIYCVLDIGGGNKGFGFFTAFGVGSRMKTFIELNLTFMINSTILSSLVFNIVVFKFFSIKGLLALDTTFINNWDRDIFSFKVGVFTCFSVKNIFRIDIGGGITLNDYYALRGFGNIALCFSFP